MRIAICDDEEFQRKNILHCLAPYQEQHPAMTVAEFGSGEELLEAMQDGDMFDFFFLDIQMRKIDGIETAQEIKKANPHAILFFITSFTQFVSAAFTLGAFQFMIKPLKQDAFDKEFKRGIAKFLMEHHQYVISSKTRTVTLEIKDITYLETAQHHIIVHAGQREFVKPGKMNDEEQKLQPFGFVRAHQGFLVNMAAIYEILTEEIKLKDGSTILLSRRKREDVMQSFNLYLAGCAV